MTFNRILVVIISTWISAYSQSITKVPGNHHILMRENVTLVWNITAESGSFSTGVWSNNRDLNVMRKVGTEDSEVLSSYLSKIVPFGQYGMTVLDTAKEDNGKYTATFNFFRENGDPLQLSEEGFIYIYDVQLPLEVNMSLNKPLRNGSKVMIGQDVTLTVEAPPNDPPAVNISIAVSYLDGSSTTEYCTNRNDTMPCFYGLNVKRGLIQIEACLKHPAVSIEPCEEIFLSGQDPNTLTSSLAPDDTSVRTYTPSSTEDPNTPTSSLAPDDTYVSTDNPSPIEDPSVTQPSSSPTVTTTPAPQPGWSHWYILLIALGCLVILVVIAVFIHRRSQSKNDDLNPVTELKSPSVHAAPADHVGANTADYRPSQHQQPRRVDNTAYYVQGTSGARL